MILTLSIIALILSLVGNILVNFKKKLGFIIWISSNIFWIVVNFVGNMNYPQVIMYLIYAGLNVQGYINWSKKNKSKILENDNLSNRDKIINYCKNVCSVDESHLENAKHNLAVINGLDAEFEGCPNNYGLTDYQGLCRDYDDDCCEECWNKAISNSSFDCKSDAESLKNDILDIMKEDYKERIDKLYNSEEVGKAFKIISERLKIESSKPKEILPISHTCNNCKYNHREEMYDQQWGRFIIGHSWCEKDRALMDSWDSNYGFRRHTNHYSDDCSEFEEGKGIFDEIKDKENYPH